MMIKNSANPLHKEEKTLTELCAFLELKLDQPYALELTEYLKYFERIYPQLFKANESTKNKNIPVHQFKKLLPDNDLTIRNSLWENPENSLPPTGLSLLKQNSSTIFDIKKEFDEEVKKLKANLSFIKKKQNSQSIAINPKIRSKTNENKEIIKKAKNHYSAMLDLLFELNTDLMYSLPKNLQTTLTNRQNGINKKDTFERNLVKDVYKIFVIDYLEKLRADIYVGDYLRKESLLEEEHQNAFIKNRTVRILINSLVINNCYERLTDLDSRKRALEQSLAILKNIGRIYPHSNTVFDFIVQNCASRAIDTSIYAVAPPPTSELDIQPFVETLEKKIYNYQTRIKHCNNKIKQLKYEISTFENQSFFTELRNPTIKINLDNLCEWLQGEKYNKLRQGTKPQKP